MEAPSSTTATRNQASTSNEKRDFRPIFINWPVDDDSVDTCDLFDRIDLSDFDVAFFDPLEFAVQNGLRSNTHDLSEMEYVSYPETNFFNFLTEIKTASESIKRLLDKNGILVVRSQIPNTQLKIRKKSSVGTGEYTESVVSPYFWLHDLIGRYQFQFTNMNTIKFNVRSNPLRKVFGDTSVICNQTQNVISEGKVEIIAQTYPSPKYPAISKVTFKDSPGQIYFIPKFRKGREWAHLIDAFERIAFNKLFGVNKLTWLSSFEIELEKLNPYQAELDEIEQQVGNLQKRKQELLKKIEETTRLIDLLVEKELELDLSVRTAFELLGFKSPTTLGSTTAESHEIIVHGDKIQRCVLRVQSTEKSPIRAGDVEALLEAVEARDLKSVPKAILVANSQRMLPPSERDAWFDLDAQKLARKYDICLMPSFELYLAACYLLKNKSNGMLDQIQKSLQRDILNCDSEFQLNRKKYALSFR